MPLFQVCGLTVESDTPFPELYPGNGNKSDVRFQWLPGTGPMDFPGEWYHQWTVPDGSVRLFLGKMGTDYFLRFPDKADFWISAAGDEVRGREIAETSPDTIRHLFLDQIIPLLLSLRGRLVLHASAVATPSGAIAFLGTSGVGKSTLAAAFCHQGFALLTDDCCLLQEEQGQFFVVPSYPGLRLWDDTLAALPGNPPALAPVAHYTDKKRFRAGDGEIAFSRETVPLRRIFLLEESEPPFPAGVNIVPLRPRDAHIQFLQYTYCLEHGDRRSLQGQFERLAQLAAAFPLECLTFERAFSCLPAVRDAILADCVR